MRILIAEDDETGAKIMAALLKHAGHETVIVTNGLEILEYLKEHNKIDLILTDIKMPTIDGETTCKILKDHLDKNIPIFAITGISENEIEKQAFDKVFLKPINMHDLINCLNQIKKGEKP